MSDKEKWVQSWFEKAQHDLQAAEAIIQSADPPYDMVCFHAQQMVEKMLKGFLTHYDQPIRKTHDLVELLTACMTINPAFSGWEDACDELTGYAVDVRYPAAIFDEPALTLAEAEKALNSAKQLHVFILAEIK